MSSEKIAEYFRHPRKIKAIKTDEQFNLIITFDNNETRLYSMKDKLDGVFSILQNPDKFRSVFIDEFGNAAWNIDETIDSNVYWNNRIDICKDALYLDSTPM